MQSRATTVLFPTPPLTSNIIDTKQRNRLMRSTRKLGAVLGTTPQVVEPEPSLARPPISISLHPQGPRPLRKLQRPTTADSENSSSFGTISNPAPTFLYSSPSMNSSVASFSQAAPSARDSRKRRPTIKSTGKRSMEIPPPLVLHLAAPAPKHHSLPQTPSTASTLTPGSRTPCDSPAVTPLTPVFPSSTESRRKRMAKLTRTLGEKIPPQLVFATRKPSVPSLRPTALAIPSLPPKGSLNEKPKNTNRRRSMSVDFVNVMNANVPPVSRSSRVWVTSTSTWWGEWNRKDIRDVQKQLRNLKAR